MKTAQELQHENEQLRAEIQQNKTYIKSLEAALIDLKKHRFGVSSEKQNSAQIPLFNEAEELTSIKPKGKVRGKKKKAGKRKRLEKENLCPSSLNGLNKSTTSVLSKKLVPMMVPN